MRRQRAVSFDGTTMCIYAFGGFDGVQALTAISAYGLIPTPVPWFSYADLPAPRANHAVATGVDGRVDVFGGANAGSTTYATVEAFDSKAAAFSEVAKLPTPRSGLAASAGTNGRIYTVGGDLAGTVEAYTP